MSFPKKVIKNIVFHKPGVIHFKIGHIHMNNEASSSNSPRNSKETQTSPRSSPIPEFLDQASPSLPDYDSSSESELEEESWHMDVDLDPSSSSTIQNLANNPDNGSNQEEPGNLGGEQQNVDEVQAQNKDEEAVVQNIEGNAMAPNVEINAIAQNDEIIDRGDNAEENYGGGNAEGENAAEDLDFWNELEYFEFDRFEQETNQNDNFSCVVCLKTYEEIKREKSYISSTSCGHILCHSCSNVYASTFCPKCKKDLVGDFIRLYT